MSILKKNKAREVDEERKVTRFDLFWAWIRWVLAVEVPVSFDRMQALSFSFSLNKVLRKIYAGRPEELQEAMKRHITMFNTNGDWGSVIHGIIISMEEERSKGNEEITPEMMQSIKVGLMGPLAGIGDSVDQGIIGTIPLAIFVPMALNGSVIAALIPSLIFTIWSIVWSWFLFNKGYTLGRTSIMTILRSGKIKKVIDIASILGFFMIGCLSASYVELDTVLEFSSSAGETVELQSILDDMLPNILPFLVVMGMYYFITKKGSKYVQIIIFTMVISILLTLMHII
ncbi:PTS system mannose/fructose/sorbose family transporter subunit IID [Tetragenococcus koreensis]|uniref:Mannose/fructose/sorbose-specific PTS system IID component n=1 Tax=Tetragenococcus koreensis TaxID=290335 RepID=A0AAN4UCR3_9ENTE|nr:PTS system mannose/fructose/sorbose family transporter subunit IID [Tetragenococcus koreensis]MDN6731244.1 PTS system mannose/fructose/sorbose family transporter subunit IID [Atopostipes suicloacalis]MCF1618142.1 PTS system mannose/fructose/sorbose family transporter subunit IID [Tetragenococcus koreensis]MCF1623007.1 PTS system mannose/fructose/sorbose family transporter subunit IID [Tetragenococcus koreensis]MCF1627192.1 PTS system mannose/fructose/sorbose family transporter subunit IID [T